MLNLPQSHPNAGKLDGHPRSPGSRSHSSERKSLKSCLSHLPREDEDFQSVVDDMICRLQQQHVEELDDILVEEKGKTNSYDEDGEKRIPDIVVQPSSASSEKVSIKAQKEVTNSTNSHTEL